MLVNSSKKYFYSCLSQPSLRSISLTLIPHDSVATRVFYFDFKSVEKIIVFASCFECEFLRFIKKFLALYCNI